jgi:hypothetical protein
MITYTSKKGYFMTVSFEDRIQYIVELRSEELLDDEEYAEKEEDYTPDLEDWSDFNTEY